MARTLGVDLASDPGKTGACSVQWEDGRALVEELAVGADDDRIVALHRRCGVTGVDAPFGWPMEFERLVRLHPVRKTAEPGWFAAAKPDLRYRVTDHVVKRATGKMPLSVSSDWIAVPAMRCQGLLARMGVTDRSGDGRVFEVYPAAALRRWGLVAPPLPPPALPILAARLVSCCPWLETTSAQRSLLASARDAFDALVCALVARAAGLGLTDRPAPEHLERARTEGWIHLPHETSLATLPLGDPR